MKLSSIQIDPARAEQGDWVDDLPGVPGVRIKARGANNSDWRKLEAKLIRQIPRGQRIEGVSPKDQDRILGRVLLETGVLDVEGFEDDNDEPIKYDRALGEKLLFDPEWVNFRHAAAYACEVVAQRRKDDDTADVKN